MKNEIRCYFLQLLQVQQEDSCPLISRLWKCTLFKTVLMKNEQNSLMRLYVDCWQNVSQKWRMAAVLLIVVVVVVVEGQYFQASLKWFLVGEFFFGQGYSKRGRLRIWSHKCILSSILSQKAASKYPTGTLTDMAVCGVNALKPKQRLSIMQTHHKSNHLI